MNDKSGHFLSIPRGKFEQIPSLSERYFPTTFRQFSLKHWLLTHVDVNLNVNLNVQLNKRRQVMHAIKIYCCIAVSDGHNKVSSKLCDQF